MTGALSEAGWGTTLLSVLIALAVACVLAFSLISRRLPWELESPGLLSRLRKRKERILRAIKDAELERQAGKLSEDELKELRNSLKQRAIVVARDLERVRRARFRSLLRSGRGGVSLAQRKHMEELVAQRVSQLSGGAPAPGPAAASG